MKAATIEEAREILAPFNQRHFLHKGVLKTSTHPSGIVVADGHAWATCGRACGRLRCDGPPTQSDDADRWLTRMQSLEWADCPKHQDWRIVGCTGLSMDVSYEDCPRGVLIGHRMICTCEACSQTGKVFCGHIKINGRRVRMPFIMGMLETCRPVLEYAHVKSPHHADPLLFRAEEFGFEAIVLGTHPIDGAAPNPDPDP